MNCSAELYSTRSTVNGDGVHCEKTEGGCQKRTTSSLMYVSDASGGVSVFEWDKRRAQVMRGRNGGGCNRPRPFGIIAIWAVVVLTKYRGMPSQVLKSAVALVLCIGAGGSEQLAHGEWVGSSSLFRKAFSASRKWCGITAAGPVAARSRV